MLVKDIMKELLSMSENGRSAWQRGVAVYATMLLEDFEGDEFVGSPADRKALLNGAANWKQYSDGGCALIYDSDIAETLCSPSELKKVQRRRAAAKQQRKLARCASPCVVSS